MENSVYRYETSDDLYTIYSVNVTVTDWDLPTTGMERSKLFKFKTKQDALEFINNLWKGNPVPEVDDNVFFDQSLVVRTNMMRSGKLVK